ncbi:sulfotransferase [Celeribacter baekdonensis]|uniref:sulfotransferase n=1 Tax=Celeribacter baekdonensis TaxID=875171 RepID=UPI0003129B6E|nr:sulfotransferase [Celeribacter baekdonensis]
MSNQFRPLLKDAFRQFLWESLNTHQQQDEPKDIALIGSRRSGSTLLMQILAHHPRVKSVDQPFSIYTATKTQMRHMPYPSGGIFVAPEESELLALEAYVRAIQSGDLHIQEPWRFWRDDYWFKTDRLVLKTTDAHYLLPHLQRWGLQTILYFRHPIPQALSCMRNGWGDRLSQFSQHHAIRTKILSDAQNAMLDQTVAQGSKLQRYVLGWCLENLPLFHALSGAVPCIFYEDLVIDPKATIQELATLCDIPVTPKMIAMLQQSSHSVKRLSDKSGRDAIKSGDSSALVGRWQNTISNRDKDAVEEILRAFQNCPYSAFEIMPQFSPNVDR